MLHTIGGQFMEEYQTFAEYFKSCNKQVQENIISDLLEIMGQRLDDDLSEVHDKRIMDQGFQCPHCQSPSIVANGKKKGVQRYRCKECGKNFSETTGTPLAWLKKKEKWTTYLRCMLSGYSLRRCAKETAICLKTSFDWRHKVLSAFNIISPERFTGICESDDIFFLYSEKGNKHLDRKPRKRGGTASTAGISKEQVAVIVTCGRDGNQDIQVAGRGRISKKDIDEVLGEKVSEHTILCTDSHRSFTAFAKSRSLEHHKIKVSQGQHVKNKVYHVQHVNNTAKRLKQWLGQFNGVSTKYMQNYFNWFMALEKLKHSTRRASQFMLMALSCNQAWFDFRNQLLNQSIIKT